MSLQRVVQVSLQQARMHEQSVCRYAAVLESDTIRCAEYWSKRKSTSAFVYAK
jgi:hypothetical protein